ncbi:phenylalanine--tRNA ligase subunit alpha [Candidatus Bathyarchaeota archaeon]|nr:phenylalanine--tRNA ligase subunit alpha [Candidatus Bathyarchaeota archaeon]MBS7628909.1 phenylalanine--tRNA ligase subunit alpha [Candidatus Bathyarchaeota archaeon]
MSTMRENEIRILSILRDIGGKARLPDIVEKSGLQDSAVMRAVLTLSNRGLVKVNEKETVMVRLSQEGTTYAHIGLPEIRLSSTVRYLGGEASLDEALSKARLGDIEPSIVLGWLRRKGLGEILRRGGSVYIRSLGMGDSDPDEVALRLIYSKGEVPLEDLKERFSQSVSRLKERNLLEMHRRVDREVELTPEGLSTPIPSVEVSKTVTALTSEMIFSGRWRNVELLEYDVMASPPPICPGKKNPYAEFMDEARRILLAMGFDEDEGPLVEAEFWNFDILFQAQDHPAREIHDSYILKYPQRCRLENRVLVERVKRTHQDGWITGSKGWGYRWDESIAERLILRTQTTAVSMRHLASHKKPPVRMFCLSKVFRPDVLDPKHSMEFTQLEGIVGDKGISMRHLLGFLQRFASTLKLGDVRFKPGYFPFTEPSVESYIKHPTLGWIEFVGAGMFRPEVLKPLGIDFPVIAWGIGFDRLAMIALNLEDIRDLHSRRLDWLRDRPMW